MIELSKKNIIYYIVVYYILIMSGSLFGLHAAAELAKINAVITVILLGYVFFGKHIGLKKNLVTAFLCISIATYVIRMFLWNEISSLVGYAGDILILIAFILWAYILDYKRMIRAFQNIMFWMSLFSIFGIVFYSQMTSIGAPVFGDSWKYHFYGIFSIRAVGSGSIRSNGLFWEPGMFQGYLVFSMMLIILKKNKSRKDGGTLIVETIALFTTRSTTGYFLMTILLMLFIMVGLDINGVNSKTARFFQCFILLVSCACVAAALLKPDILYGFLRLFPEDVTGKLMDTSNISTNSRLYGMIYDVRIALDNPLGIGRNVAQKLLREQMSITGIEILGRTSSWTTALIMDGIVGGLIYIYIWIKSSFSLSSNTIIGVFVCLIMAVIANTEPHYGNLFFNMVVVMWYMRKNSEMEAVREGIYEC